MTMENRHRTTPRDTLRAEPARRENDRESAENLLEGRNAVTEAIAAGRPIDKIFLASGEHDRALARIAALRRSLAAPLRRALAETALRRSPLSAR